MNNTTKNSDLFINAYNQIDAFLRKEGEFDSDASFTYKVKSSKNSAVKKFKDDLIGLKTLWQTGRLHIFQTNCTHAGHKTEDCFPQMENLTFPFLF